MTRRRRPRVRTVASWGCAQHNLGDLIGHEGRDGCLCDGARGAWRPSGSDAFSLAACTCLMMPRHGLDGHAFVVGDDETGDELAALLLLGSEVTIPAAGRR
jgi:hypothetical protein